MHMNQVISRVRRAVSMLAWIQLALALGCKGTPSTGKAPDPAATGSPPSIAADSSSASPRSSSSTPTSVALSAAVVAQAPAAAGNGASAKVQRLGGQGDVVSEWTPGPDDPPPATAGQLDVVPFQHPSPDKWYYLVAEHDHAFNVVIQGEAKPWPKAETQAAVLSDGSKATTSKVTLAHEDGFVEVLATPLSKAPADVDRALHEHLTSLADARQFTTLHVTCGNISETPSCSMSAEQAIGSATVKALLWAAYLDKQKLMVSYNAFDLVGDDMRTVAIELIRRTFSVGPDAKIQP